jgi:hypothetical protein
MQQVMVHFDFPSVTAEQYDNVWKDLRAQGYADPKGLIFHAGAPKPDGGWVVTDVWESEEAFKEFGKVLMPLIQKQDIPSVTPKIYPVRYFHERNMQTA